MGFAVLTLTCRYTYGIAGAFWLHDAYHDGDGVRTWRRKWFQASLAAFTFLAGLFICVAGNYVTIKGIIEAYNDGTVPAPFSC